MSSTLSIDKIVSFIAPSICIGCGSTGAVLCSHCLLIAGEPPVPRCAGCRALSNDKKTCSSCRSWLDIYSVHVATHYEGVYEQLVHALKFDMKRGAAGPIAHMMASIAPHIKGHVIVCPLPTAPARVRTRGFDHSALLVQHFMDQLSGNSAYEKWSVESFLGRRTNVRQVGSSRSQRIQQMKHEFYIKNDVGLSGATIVLFDDVMTTGASLAAAAKTLKKAGARRVYALVFAQK